MNQSSYDPTSMLKRAARWREAAAATPVEEDRAFCLAEADRCERRVHLSRFTPVLRESSDRPDSADAAGTSRRVPERRGRPGMQ